MSYAFSPPPGAPALAPTAAAPSGPKIFAAQHEYPAPELEHELEAQHAPEHARAEAVGDVAPAHAAPSSPAPDGSFSASPSLSPLPSPLGDGPLSLASHYLPGKIGRMHRLGSRRHRGSSPYVDQQRRSNYEPIHEEDGPATPTASSRGSLLGAGAFRRGDPARWSTLSANIAAAKTTPRPTLSQLAAEEDFSPDLPPLGGHRSAASSLRNQARFSEIALPKQGAGRDAWGPNGGGHAVLGAGGFEDDDGINLAFASGSNGAPRDSELRQRGTVFSVTAKEVLDTYKDDPDTNGERNVIRRIFGTRDEDGKHKRRLRWNKFKWALLVANTLLTVIAIGGLVGTILTWTNVWARSDVVRIVNRTELILSTTAASLMFVTAILGWAGILLNNRAFLAVWTLLLWIDFAFLVAPGYIAYKRHTFNLEGKMNEAWSRSLGVDNRRAMQNTLTCCGWFSPLIEASESNLCYARSSLPGCKGRLTRFERKALRWIYTCSFSLVGPHLVLIVVALLSSNHITYRFGKGLTPQAYRLNSTTVARIQEDFLTKLTDMYGPQIVPAVLATQKRLQQDRRSVPDDNRSSVQLLNPAPDGSVPPQSPSESYLPHSSQSHLGSPIVPADADLRFAAAYDQSPMAYAQSRDHLMHQ